ncbi:MAG TPA: DUF4038 domain-containing protein [Bryobacteraceae bacterium]|nr:DUF4038 domain-containing protein [Bryobacteraceae bacterium]
MLGVAMLISRRSLLSTVALAPLGAGSAAGQARFGTARTVAEWAFRSGKSYADPFQEVELDVAFSGPDGIKSKVPAFWDGESVWRVRYAPPAPGRYTWSTICNDRANPDLHGVSGTLEVAAYAGRNPLYLHGPIRVAADRRHFEHADGTPFFWLGDTWWMGLCQRLRWPEDFQALAADRVAKGFSVVQIVAGLYPDMPPFDPRGKNEAGYPWESGFARIQPAYFDAADVRIQYLVDRGLMPCIVGCWGYFLPLMGLAKMKQHWRYLVARWGAYPVVWCLAGEGTMPFYLSKTPKQDSAAQKQGWTEVARYVREIDPARHVITIHPSQTARDSVEDPEVLDFDMLQTGHSDRASYPTTVNRVTESLTRTPPMPVLVGEVCYEGILEASREEVQRFVFWASILSGAAGHTYGANGIWQVNRADQPYGLSPHGHSWGDTPWDVAARLPGSRQLGIAKALLARYRWWRLEPHPEGVEPHWTRENYLLPYAARIPGEAHLVFLPAGRTSVKVRNLEAGLRRAFFFNPSDGSEHLIGTASPDSSGVWQAPDAPIFRDWVLVVDKGALP